MPIAILWSAAHGLTAIQLAATGESVERFESRLAKATTTDTQAELGSTAHPSNVHFLHFLWLKRSLVNLHPTWALQKCVRRLARALPHLERFALFLRNLSCKAVYVVNRTAIGWVRY